MAKRSQRRDRASRRSQPAPQQRITPRLVAIVAAVVVLLVAVVVVFAQRQAAPQPTPPVAVLPSTRGYPVGTTPEGYPYKGNPDAKVTLVEYSDYQCPICASYHERVDPKIDEELIKTGKAKFVWKDFAFIGDESKAAAHAGLCALEQGRFWEYHDLLFRNQGAENSGAFKREKLLEFAQAVGLDAEAFTRCVDSGKYTAQINRSTQEGRNQGVDGTPTTFVDDRKVLGADFESIAAAVEAAIGQTQ